MKLFRKYLASEPIRIICGLLLFVPALIFDNLGYEIAAVVLYISALVASGIAVFRDAAMGILRRDFLDEKFLMTIASVGAVIIGEYSEGVAVMLFFLVGEYFEHRATQSARNSIKSLMDICPDTARVVIGDGESEVDTEDVEVGTIILIRPGERVPIDAVITEGSCEVDTSALTGEAVPRPVTIGDEINSGTVVLGGAVKAQTLRIAEESRASRVLSLVEDASDRKSREESFITAFSRYYTPAVIVLALLMATVPPILNLLDFGEAVYRALSFLVVSCPCALVISVPMAFFGGIGRAASRGVLYKGGNIFAPTARTKTVVFDKTGTLTTGEFSVVEVCPVKLTEGELLTVAASAEHNSNHPIARGIAASVENHITTDSSTELVGRGIEAVLGGKRVAVGNAALMREEGIAVDLPLGVGIIYVAIDGEYAGYIRVEDTVKPEARQALDELRRLGVKRTYILSGDREESIAPVAEALGIDKVYAELLPEDKYLILEEIIRDGGGVMYVGDGINDAPCLARADVGVAMGERGQDSAIEAADLVIMSDNLERLPDAMKIARKTLSISKQNIVFAIGIKLLAIILVATSLAGMWLAVFADVGVAVLAILNAMRTLLGKKKREVLVRSGKVR